MKSLKRALSVALILSVLAVTLSFFGCAKKRPEYISPDALDVMNEKGTSYWSSIAFVTEEARAAGYTGSDACQHLNSITRSKQNKNLLFFGTDAAGVCKSVDGGKTWRPCNNGLFTSGVCRVEIDPKNDNHLVAINVTGGETTSNYTGLYYSYDCGDTWKKAEILTHNDSASKSVGFAASQYYYDVLEIDEGSYDPTLGYCTDVYFSTPCERDAFPSKLKSNDAYKPNKGLYKSTDCGEKYEKIDGSEALTDGIIVINGVTVAVANMNGVFVLNKNGYSKMSELNVHSLLFVNGKYYLQTEDGIYVSTNLVKYERLISDSFPAEGKLPRNLEISRKNSDYMLLFARKTASNKYSTRPYYSHDGGKTWSLGTLNDGEELFYYYTYHAGTYTFDPDDESTVVGIIGGEVIRSVDGGESYFYSGEGVSNINVGGQFRFNIYDENLLYTGAYDFGGALTVDGGKTWKNISLSKDGDGKDIMGGYAADRDTLFGVYVDTWSPGDYFADYRYVCYSHDGGKTVNIDPGKVIKASEYKNTDKEDVYVSLKVDSSIGTSYESSYQSPNNRKVLFCANYRSTDNGYTWKSMLDAKKGEQCLQVYYHSGKTLYGCSKQSGYVLKSDDDGKTWKRVNSVELEKWTIWDGKQNRPVSAPSHITDIAIDEKNGYLYAVYYRRLFRMRLDGSEITNCNEGMARNNFSNTINIRSVAVDPNCPEIVYVCGSGDFYMDCESVRRSCDSGATWQTVTPSGSPSCIVNDGSSLGYEGRCVRVRSDGEVWVGTLCLGFSRLTPPYTLK